MNGLLLHCEFFVTTPPRLPPRITGGTFFRSARLRNFIGLPQ
jgi:hypothetical protein